MSLNKGLPIGLALAGCATVLALWLCHPDTMQAGESLPLSGQITSRDALLIADPEGQIIYKINEKAKCIPASTLKLLTALTAIHHLGEKYRYKTEIFLDDDQNLKLKGYGDPMLVSEVLQKIAGALAGKLREFDNLVLDDSYFVPDIRIPGVGTSTNPYDALNGALCANFNTIFFKRNENDRVVSAELQTPMIPFAVKKIESLKLKNGRHAVFRNHRDPARYAGNLLVHFLKDKGVNFRGEILMGTVKPTDKLFYSYRSDFTLEQILKKMLEFSNNFIANQILFTMGAHVYGPPGTLRKGINIIYKYSREVLHVGDIDIAEGSGVSKKNRLSALDMLAILRRFEPHRAMLTREGNAQYKSGHLENVKTRAGYIHYNSGPPYYFVIFLNRPNPDIDSVMGFVENLEFAN